MNLFGKLAMAAAIGGGALTASSIGASAAIVCSGTTCWHAQETYEYPETAHVIVHPDNWTWGESDHYTWREHTGRGYWHGDQWDDF